MSMTKPQLEEATTESESSQARAVIYLRVSTDEQTRRDGDPEGYSIPAQREACLRKAESLGAEVVQEFSDPGRRASDLKRPGLLSMMEFIKTQGNINYVIVHKLNRIQRTVMLDAMLEMDLAETGSRLISVTQDFDPSPSGKLIRRILAAVDQHEVENLATEAKKGMEQKAKIGGTPFMAPLGYLNVRQFIAGADIRTVEVDPERARMIQWAFKAYASGKYSVQALQQALTDKGLRTKETRKRTPKPVSRSVLSKSILKNAYYTGVVVYKGVEIPG